MAAFASVGLRELWVHFVVGEKTRFISIRTPLVKLGADKDKLQCIDHVIHTYWV